MSELAQDRQPPDEKAIESAETSPSDPQPILILAPARSEAERLAAMIGRNPCAYDLPELNLFMADTFDDLMLQMVGSRQTLLHGLLRAIAEIYAGEQSKDGIDMARRWLLLRRKRTTGAILQELQSRVAPLALVESSPSSVTTRPALTRLADAFPNARYVHLVRHPVAHGTAVMQFADGVMAVEVNSIDYATEPPTVDPQLMWYRTHNRIRRFLNDIPDDRQIRISAESLLATPETTLAGLCRHLGLPDDRASVARMLQPEASAFAHFGPVGAHLGRDSAFLEAPGLPGLVSEESPTLDDPLPWRSDNASVRREVRMLAKSFGYD